ncbi:hypothetical protein [Pseudonocardia sp.]|jgi:hypothetical protein|uniref:hypothetical protein n=1 Tax=Pseudonocardia sp. TaxID=60912 RepID=UPI0031FC58DA
MAARCLLVFGRRDGEGCAGLPTPEAGHALTAAVRAGVLARDSAVEILDRDQW